MRAKQYMKTALGWSLPTIRNAVNGAALGGSLARQVLGLASATWFLIVTLGL